MSPVYLPPEDDGLPVVTDKILTWMRRPLRWWLAEFAILAAIVAVGGAFILWIV